MVAPERLSRWRNPSAVYLIGRGRSSHRKVCCGQVILVSLESLGAVLSQCAPVYPWPFRWNGHCRLQGAGYWLSYLDSMLPSFRTFVLRQGRQNGWWFQYTTDSDGIIPKYTIPPFAWTIYMKDVLPNSLDLRYQANLLRSALDRSSVLPTEHMNIIAPRWSDILPQC